MLFILSDFIHAATFRDPRARRWDAPHRRFRGNRHARDNL